MAKAPGLGERACPKCKEVIKADALICKHCHTEFSAEEVAAAQKEASQNKKVAGVGCLAILLMLGYCGYAAGDDEAPASIPNEPAPTAKADVSAFYKNVMGVIRPCDQAGKRVAEASGTKNLVAVYQAATAAEDACLSTPSEIKKIAVPASVGKSAHAELLKTREVCENAYVQRWSLARTMKKVIDENGAIKHMADAQETAELVQMGTIACAAGLTSQAMALGATEADLK